MKQLNRYKVEERILKNVNGEPFGVWTVWDRHTRQWIAYYHQRQLAREYAWELERLE